MSDTATAGGSTSDQARDKAQEMGGQAKEKAQEVGAQARGRVRDEVDRRSTEAGEQAGSAAQALRRASDQLREDGNEPVARGFEQVAQRVERAGGWLRDTDGDAILRDVEDFGRRNPLAVVAGGMALGFAASRLLKASSRRRYEESASYGGNGRSNRIAAPRNRLPATTPTPGVPPTASPERPREGLTEGGLTGGTPATGTESERF
jgi:hypothetical protein